MQTVTVAQPFPFQWAALLICLWLVVTIEDERSIATRASQQLVSSPRVSVDKFGNIIHLPTDADKAVALTVVLSQLFPCEVAGGHHCGG